MPGTGRAEPRIAVLGCGIGGLATAAFLRRAGLTCAVYEQAGRLREVGAGLVVAPNAARLLRRLGVLDQFQRRAVQLDVGWEFRRWQDGTVLSAEDLASSCLRLYGEHTYTAHRADLLRVLSSAVPAGTVQLGRKCVEVTVTGPRPRLRFADGETVEPDVLIGADGVHSVVRQAIADPAPPTYSGICAFRPSFPPNGLPRSRAVTRRPCGSARIITWFTTRSPRAATSTSSPSPRRAATPSSRGRRPRPSRNSSPSSRAGILA